MPDKIYSARDVLTYMFAESKRWEEDVDGDEDRVFVHHNIRISDSLLEELLDMAGITKSGTYETTFQRLERANEEDSAAIPEEDKR